MCGNVVYQFQIPISADTYLMNCPTVASVPSWMDSDNNRIVGGKNAPSPIPWQVSIGNADSGH